MIRLTRRYTCDRSIRKRKTIDTIWYGGGREAKANEKKLNDKLLTENSPSKSDLISVLCMPLGPAKFPLIPELFFGFLFLVCIPSFFMLSGLFTCIQKKKKQKKKKMKQKVTHDEQWDD